MFMTVLIDINVTCFPGHASPPVNEESVMLATHQLFIQRQGIKTPLKQRSLNMCNRQTDANTASSANNVQFYDGSRI